MSSSPIELIVSPRLDKALRESGFAWEEAARDEGSKRVSAWLRQRLGPSAAELDVSDPVEALLAAPDDDARLFARVELAELLEGEDDLLADALWETTLAHGISAEDGDVIFEAASHLAAIAEDHDDPLAAAEYHIDFLNWRRTPGHTADPEHVATSFEEITRLAEIDGDPRAAALFAFRHVGFTRLVDAEEERASTGDWETEPAPYNSWA